jgi:hypothetical protein
VAMFLTYVNSTRTESYIRKKFSSYTMHKIESKKKKKKKIIHTLRWDDVGPVAQSV